jgi:thiol-disulfide isomerase/thioredoxin
MKQLLALLLFIPLFAQAQFKVTVSKSNAPVYFRGTLFDDKNYLAKDTLTGTVLSSTTPIKGGIYYLQFSSTKERIYFTIENKEQFSLTFSGPDVLATAHSSDSKNEVFLNYQRLEKSYTHLDSSYQAELSKGRKFKFAEKAAFFQSKTDTLVAFRNKQLETLPSASTLALYFKALNALDESVPNRLDTEARDRFFSKIPFQDSRLLFTPIFRSLLVEYLSYYPLNAESIQLGMEKVMSKIICSHKSFPFVFDYFNSVIRNRNIARNTEGTILFLKTYGVADPCESFTAAQKTQFNEEVEKLSRLSANQLSENLILKDTAGQVQNLHQFAAEQDYTLLMFYAPTCDHCQREVPEMDSIATVISQVMNLKIGRFAVCNEPEVTPAIWKDFIHRYQVTTNVVHVELPENAPQRSFYDAFSNPTFYLLNRKREIVAKKISPTSLRKYFAELQKEAIQ